MIGDVEVNAEEVGDGWLEIGFVESAEFLLEGGFDSEALTEINEVIDVEA